MADRTGSGRLFQREAANELKALAPVLVLILGMDRVIPLFDLSERDGREMAIMMIMMMSEILKGYIYCTTFANHVLLEAYYLSQFDNSQYDKHFSNF